MPPQATKRKATTTDGGGSPKKSAVDTRTVGSDSVDRDEDTADEKPFNLTDLPRDCLDVIYSFLPAPDRFNLHLTCARLIDVEKRAPGARSESCAHLAIRNTVEYDVDDGAKRSSRRRPNMEEARSRTFMEIAMHQGVQCVAHADTHSFIDSAACRLKKDGSRGSRTSDPFGKDIVPTRYWKVTIEDAPDIIQSIAKTVKLDVACIELDLLDRSLYRIVELVRDLRCPAISLVQGKVKSVEDRIAGVQTVEEVTRLPRRIWATLPFFYNTETLLIKNVRLERGDIEEFYRNVKGSSLRKIELIYDQGKVATAQVGDFIQEAIPWAARDGQYHVWVWSDRLRRGERDGQWLIKVKLGTTRRLIIEKI